MKTKMTNPDVIRPAPPVTNGGTNRGSRWFESGEAWRQRGQSFQREVRVVCLILKDSRTPWYARAVAACTVGYLFSPVQLIPSFIPVIGLLDDFAVLWAGFALIRHLAPNQVLSDCMERAARIPAFSITGMNVVARIGTVAIIAVWLIIAFAATRWVLR
jgi:uncharacterized membrane protein YkvA (DUF1232 family)